MKQTISNLSMRLKALAFLLAIIFNAAAIDTQLTGSLELQSITFPAIPAKVTGIADFSAGATASSGLAVSLTSSNTDVATIVNGNIHIVGVGTSIITASQAGNASFDPADNVTQTLTVTAPVITNIALNKPATTSSIYIGTGSYGGDLAVDGNNATRWASGAAVATATLEVDLVGTYTFSQVVILDYKGRVATYKIQYWDGTSWLDAYSGTTIGTTDKTVNFTAVTGTKVRLNILTCSVGGPTIWEFVVNGYNRTISQIKSNIELDALASNQLDTNTLTQLDAYPNPVANNLTLSYSLSNSGLTTLDIYNLSGSKIKSIVTENAVKGNYKAEVNVNDLPNGFYIVRLKNNNIIKCVKISVER